MANIRYKHTRVIDADIFCNAEWVKPGAMCVLVGYCNESTPERKMWYTLQRGKGSVSGNVDGKPEGATTDGGARPPTSAGTPSGFGKFWRSMSSGAVVARI